MNEKWLHLLLVLLMLAAVGLTAGCDCGDDDDDDDVTPDDDDDDTTPDDDDTVPDDDDTTPDDDDTTPDDDDTTPGDDDTADICDWEAHDPWIVQGKEHLAAGEAEEAYDAFFEAYVLCPEVPDAKLGIILADVQYYLSWFNYWINFLLNFNPAPHEDGAKSIGTVIQEIIREYLMPINDEMFAMADDLMENHTDLRFYIEELPMWMDGDEVVIEMGGEWDIADVQNLKSFTRVLEALEQFLISFDLTFNYYTFSHWPQPGSGWSIEQIIHSYSELILELLADPDYPDLFTFLDGGEDHFAESATQFGLGCLDMVTAFDMALDEIDLQQDDVLGYVDANGNGQWDEGENYILPYFGPLSEPLQITIENLLILAEDLGGAMLDTGPEDVHPNLPDWFLLSNLNFILEYLDLLIYGFRLPPIPVPVGYWFYHPLDDGLRSIVGAVAQLLYDNTTPPPEEVVL